MDKDPEIMSDNKETEVRKAETTLEDIEHAIQDVYGLVTISLNKLAMFEAKLAELENKLPGALDAVMGNPLLKPFLKMVTK